VRSSYRLKWFTLCRICARYASVPKGYCERVSTKLNGKHPTAKRSLLPRQERFCEFIASGMSGTDAWLAAGYKVERNVAKANASESLTKPDVAARIAELRKPQTEKALLTKDRKRALLMEFAEDPQIKTPDRLRAIELDAKLAGHFAPEQVTLEKGPNPLDDLSERANRVASILNRRAMPPVASNGLATVNDAGHTNIDASANRTGYADGPMLLRPGICARYEIVPRV